MPPIPYHKQKALLLTCEHATNKIPQKYASFFHTHRTVSGPWGRKKVGKLLEDHWGYDPGALWAAKYLQKKLSSPLFFFPYSRLFIEIDSYLKSSLISNILSKLPKIERARLREQYWTPYAERIKKFIEKQNAAGAQIVHIASHSFTPVFKGKERHCDIGVLYDPQRKKEAEVARLLCATLKHELPGFIVRRNYPYTGKSEGLTTHLRKLFKDSRYIGIEIEVNQKYASQKSRGRRKIQDALVRALNLIQ
ncbi:MAG: N-formylglutamate amidohydrolase [Patescibacteria group bacterium]